VESQKGKSVEVFFVDFGNTDRVDSLNVVGLPAEFGALQVQVQKDIFLPSRPPKVAPSHMIY
jgi:hypothetical protein